MLPEITPPVSYLNFNLRLFSGKIVLSDGRVGGGGGGLELT